MSSRGQAEANAQAFTEMREKHPEGSSEVSSFWLDIQKMKRILHF